MNTFLLLATNWIPYNWNDSYVLCVLGISLQGCIREHHDQMRKPPQLSPFNVKEKKFSDVSGHHSSLRVSLATLRKPRFSNLYTQSHSFPNFMTVVNDWNVDWLVIWGRYQRKVVHSTAQLSLLSPFYKILWILDIHSISPCKSYGGRIEGSLSLTHDKIYVMNPWGCQFYLWL